MKDGAHRFGIEIAILQLIGRCLALNVFENKWFKNNRIVVTLVMAFTEYHPTALYAAYAYDHVFVGDIIIRMDRDDHAKLAFASRYFNVDIWHLVSAGLK